MRGFAWYGHPKGYQSSPWYLAALASWCIALFEYLLQVPANRLGLKWIYMWAGLCLMWAVFLIFRN